MKTRVNLNILLVSLASLLFTSCSNNPVGRTDDEPITNNNSQNIDNHNPKSDTEIMALKVYYSNGCLVKAWDAPHGNPLGGTWASWTFMWTDEWGGLNFQCSAVGADCIQYSWRAVYCGILSSDDIPTPDSTNNVAYIQTLMSQAGQTFIGDLNDWTYEEIYVQPNYQFPAGTSQININFVDSVDYYPN